MLKTKSLKPFLKWAGGKSRIADKLNALYDPHRDRRLVEPFCGGLGVALGLMPEEALLNDINPDLINFYRVIQDCKFEYVGENTSEYYYATRNRLNTEKPGNGSYQAISDYYYEHAQDFYYLNLAGFNGLCRYNQSGAFNVSYGNRKKLAICGDFSPYHEAVKSWDFQCDNYQELRITAADFLFVDPPYHGTFTSYSGNQFGWKEQVELAYWLDQVEEVPMIACNAATPEILELYTDRGWDIEIVDMHTSISSNGDQTPSKEMFATRYF